MTVTAPPPVRPPTGSQRLLAAPGPGFDDHRHTHGPLPLVGPGTIDEIGRAGVDGRGGAGFPLARKLAAVAARSARASGTGRGHDRTPVVIGNAAEGEPASRKDAVLLERAPHLVLDGLVVAALAVGAREAVVATSDRLAVLVRRALDERATAAATWTAAPDPVALDVRPLSHTSFVAGEAGALASAVAGGRGLPEDRVVRLAERGPSARPTLVANVETLAQAALVARHGAAWARSVGSAGAPGTRLVTVSDVTDPAGAVVLETAGGAPIGELLVASRLDVADPRRTRAVLVGGWGGTWVPAAALDAPLDVDGLAPWGAAPGAGVLAVLDHRRCPVTVTARIAGALADASAGRCGPCVNGLARIAEVVSALASGRATGAVAAEVQRLTALVDGRGACHHPDGVARMVRSAVRVFRDDVQAHLGGRCLHAGGAR
ncbi:NADH-ubiquinone oxidoreductase-F iron-sulfur binding region domain-containing protein [Curtobacterium sp. A7_M15]|uniref:NADH-ubiquinone oxidoreductase-F iron-sulfur binding region domain-containing protein n=1 Tax=Curtobacterium sp. A7_M15 TaxID=3065241 RepID=UPI002737DE44|nr:NADH-ubiquinone oxidoreductase-F iron-sulfur binding region domain-containing protein [Curtobacterium sp. A7_M15]MDP4334186.1 NADH-ubiquinone oxidoreductase-F iron-sulfur binding region domain-containing protein [Curtobacterium sp. A7_M15]